MAKEALRFSFEGSRGGPKVGTDWCGNVKSITEQISTPEYCQGAGKGSTSLAYRVAPRRSPASLDAVRSQPEVDTQDDDDDEQKVEVGQCARRC
jgi:hypothetical protein